MWWCGEADCIARCAEEGTNIFMARLSARPEIDESNEALHVHLLTLCPLHLVYFIQYITRV